VEQQRNLLTHAPSDYDLLALMRVMTEKCATAGRCRISCAAISVTRESARRRSCSSAGPTRGTAARVVQRAGDNWLDFFTYTQFIDRDGKFQLTMLSVSAFDPLSRSMNPMLKEESFHLGTGNNGLLRMVKAGKMPPR